MMGQQDLMEDIKQNILSQLQRPRPPEGESDYRFKTDRRLYKNEIERMIGMRYKGNLTLIFVKSPWVLRAMRIELHSLSRLWGTIIIMWRTDTGFEVKVDEEIGLVPYVTHRQLEIRTKILDMMKEWIENDPEILDMYEISEATATLRGDR